MKIEVKYTLVVLAVFFTSISWAQKDTTVIQILHMNDMHGKIERFPQAKYIIDSIKSTNKEVFLCSAGDLFSGNPIVDRHEKKGWPIIDLMNDMGFDVSAIGNHEFDFGQSIMNERIGDADFPFISANIIAKSSILKQPKPYTILTTDNGLKLAVFSVIQLGSNGKPSSHPRNFDGIQFTTAEAAFDVHKKELKAYDMQIALTHLGYGKDKEIAEQYPWVDLIMGGHSHTKLEPAHLIGKTLVTQAGGNVKYIGVNTIKFVDDKLISIKNQLIPLKHKSKDKTIEAKVKAYAKNPVLQAPVAHLPYDIENDKELGELMASAYQKGLKVDIAFQNIGGVRIKQLKEGTIRLMDVMYLDPFNNELMVFEMTQKDILSFLRYAFTVRDKNNQLMSGLKAEFVTDENGDLVDVKLKDMNNNPLDKSKKYRVAINSYMANSYDFSVKEKAEYTGAFSNDLIIEYLKKYFPYQEEK